MDGAEIYGGLARLALLHHICLRHEQGFVLLDCFTWPSEVACKYCKSSSKLPRTHLTPVLDILDE